MGVLKFKGNVAEPRRALDGHAPANPGAHVPVAFRGARAASALLMRNRSGLDTCTTYLTYIELNGVPQRVFGKLWEIPTGTRWGKAPTGLAKTPNS